MFKKENKKAHLLLLIVIIAILVLNITTLIFTIKNQKEIENIRNAQGTNYQMMNQVQSRIWMMQSRLEQFLNQQK